MTVSAPAAMSEVDRYVETYLRVELVQEPANADLDPQLATIAPLLADRLSRASSGVIIDLGCGKGPLLARLLSIDQFVRQPGWLYLGVGEEEDLTGVHQIARKAMMNRRVELVTLDEFYQTWPHISEHQLIVCRNVLHELSISSTAILLESVASNMGSTDELIIQDLLRLPQAERHNACWTVEAIEQCLGALKFPVLYTISQTTRSGNFWFNLVASTPPEGANTGVHFESEIGRARLAQWTLWTELEREAKESSQGRNALVEALDVDLQLAALTRQLRNHGLLQVALDASVERRIRTAEFVQRISDFVAADALQAQVIDEVVHFRERGEQLNALEEYLRGPGSLATIHGGRGSGKTTLLRHLLTTRSYSKAPVIIDGRTARGLWPFVEQLLSQIGLRLLPDYLSILSNLSFKSIEVSLRQLLNRFADRIIVVVDNFDELVDSNRTIMDNELESLLALLVSKAGAKFIMLTSNELVPVALQKAAAGAAVTTVVRVGRYAADETVVNVLDDHFDRASAGLDAYPDTLVNAIDRHPLIAALASQSLGRFGPGILLSDQFITELKLKLRSQLWNRLVDDLSRPAMRAASNLRVSVPANMLERLSSPESVHQARNADLLYSVSDRRWSMLIAVLGLFRLREVEDTLPAAAVGPTRSPDDIDHEAVADLYWATYRADDDPKWMREGHYHRMLSGGVEAGALQTYAGKYYLPELVGSAEYAYSKRRDYRLALMLFNAAAAIQPLTEGGSMRRASCLIRVSDRARGEAEFRALVAAYPTNKGIKTSHVDALLYVRDHRSALETLEAYDLEQSDSSWIAYQWGRVYLGLDRYEEAISVFERLTADGTGDSHIYVFLARALQQHGALRDAIRVLRDAAARFPSNAAVQTSLGVDLERAKEDGEALAILEPLFVLSPDNIRAALAIMRIQLRAGMLEPARRTFRRASNHAPEDVPGLLTTAKAELLMAEGRPEAAADLVRASMAVDSTLVGMYFEAIYQWARMEDGAQRREIAGGGLKIQFPESLRGNVPVQINRARMTILAGDVAEFEKTLTDLSSTRVDPNEIAKLRDAWSEENGKEVGLPPT